MSSERKASGYSRAAFGIGVCSLSFLKDVSPLSREAFLVLGASGEESQILTNMGVSLRGSWTHY